MRLRRAGARAGLIAAGKGRPRATPPTVHYQRREVACAASPNGSRTVLGGAACWSGAQGGGNQVGGLGVAWAFPPHGVLLQSEGMCMCALREGEARGGRRRPEPKRAKKESSCACPGLDPRVARSPVRQLSFGPSTHEACPWGVKSQSASVGSRETRRPQRGGGTVV